MGPVRNLDEPYPLNLYCRIFGCNRNELSLPKDYKETIKCLLCSLEKREAECLMLRFKENMTLAETGYRMGNITSSQARQIENRALRHLREPGRVEFLKYGVQECSKQPKQFTEPEANNTSNNVSLDAINISVRAYNCLRRAGCDTLEDVAELTREQVRKRRNVGATTLYEIETALNAHGMTFAS